VRLGAYYIAVAADEIYVDKASIVGSIGVLMDGFGFTGLMDKLGVERRLLTAGENKGMLDPFSPQTDKHAPYAQAMLDQIHQQFIAVVKAGRATASRTPDTFSGLFWTASRPSSWAWPTSWATWTTWRAKWSRPKTSSTTPARQRGRAPGQALWRRDGRGRGAAFARWQGGALDHAASYAGSSAATA
jgi:hypothetical protein